LERNIQLEVTDKMYYPFKVAYADHAIPSLASNKKHLICEIKCGPTSLLGRVAQV
jgi:hypothetical protein